MAFKTVKKIKFLSFFEKIKRRNELEISVIEIFKQ